MDHTRAILYERKRSGTRAIAASRYHEYLCSNVMGKYPQTFSQCLNFIPEKEYKAADFFVETSAMPPYVAVAANHPDSH